MRQRFFLDRERGRVVGEFTPTADHSGAPNYAHGGATMAVLDDAMAWAIIATKERFPLSRRMETDFLRPVMVGKTYAVEAWVDLYKDRAVEVRAELRSGSGKVCVSARGTYMVMTEAEAEAAIGFGAVKARSYTDQPE
jgi:acyl-coenzyme A thioesterase PaaI-like protein